MADYPIPFTGPMVCALLAGRKTQTRRVLAPQPFASGYYEGEIEMLSKPQDDGRLGCRFSALAVGGGGIITDWIETRYAIGDRLWVREAWRTWADYDEMSGKQIVEMMADAAHGPAGQAHIEYLADGAIIPPLPDHPWDPGRYRHARFMPRAFSRLMLTVTDVRVQRIQDISEADAIAEGVSDFVERLDRPGSWDGITAAADRNALVRINYGSCRAAYSHLWDDINGACSWGANPLVTAYSFTVDRGNIDDDTPF